MTDIRHQLPAVHQILADAERAGIATDVPRQIVVDVVRRMLTDARREGGSPPEDGWMAELTRRVAEARRPSLIPLVNATGVVLHTNLGRAPLAEAAVEAMTRVARYSTLEYDLERGDRGSRQVHVRTLLRELTGAEDALVVNNAASALIVILNALAERGETIVSRGELVEIGGAFRIPEILARSGSVLVEVGTTNRTRRRDYELALSPRTRCVLKVHRSNFVLSGFTEETAVDDLMQFAAPHGIPVVHDVGSGLMVDLEAFGLRGEPRVQDSVEAGSVVVFSGDKLMGGPQSGIIVGPQSWIARVAASPFSRAFRPDKLVLAALEATLDLYRDPATALHEIPTLAMLTADRQTIAHRAARLASLLPSAATEPGNSSVGGGSFPDVELPTTLVAVPTSSPDRLLEALRRTDPPVIARAGAGKVLLDPRTMTDPEVDTMAAVFRAVSVEA